MASHWRPEVLLPLLLLGAGFGTGWIRLSRRTPGVSWIMIGRFALAYGGLVSIGIALLSPLDELAHRFFVAHMTQHMLLVMVAAPALLLADPFPIVLWALPARARTAVGHWLEPGAPTRRILRFVTRMEVTWLAFALVMWLWHLPAAYDAALAAPRLHDLEHLTLFGAAGLFWWPVIDPAPRVRDPVHPGRQIVYLVLGAFQTSALGLVLAASPTVVYRSYELATGAPGLTPLADQAWGGIVMWAGGGAIEMLAVMILLFRFLSLGERRRSGAAT